MNNLVEQEINVYVVSLEQPFENWFGTLKSYDFKKGTCIIENGKEEDIIVRMNEVQEANTSTPIKEFLLKQLLRKSFLNTVKSWGLSEEEAQTFYSLSLKIKPSEEAIKDFYTEMDEGVPFEGGMGSTEAIVGLVESLKN